MPSFCLDMPASELVGGPPPSWGGTAHAGDARANVVWRQSTDVVLVSHLHCRRWRQLAIPDVSRAASTMVQHSITALEPSLKGLVRCGE